MDTAAVHTILLTNLLPFAVVAPPATTTKCVYKPDSMSTDEFIIIVGDEDAAKKWLGGDKTIPLVEIVDSFEVFHSGQGAQGLLARPSKQQLDAVFGTTKEDEIVQQILEKGRMFTGKDMQGLGGGYSKAKDKGAHLTSRGAVGGGR
ncbi:hypothetical protein OIV83_000687 [Microbotryomycetes sp. JL201]|nr:hypothetical protein OIV83_000687 [Microbotryomycetes sp. JL201]